MEGGEGGGGDGGYRGEAGVDMKGGEVLHQPPPPQKIRFLPPLPSFALLYIYISRCLLSFVAETATRLMLVDTRHVEFCCLSLLHP